MLHLLHQDMVSIISVTDGIVLLPNAQASRPATFGDGYPGNQVPLKRMDHIPLWGVETSEFEGDPTVRH